MEKYPDIAATWSPKNDCTPYDVWPTTNKPKFLWVCEKHGEYPMACFNRIKPNRVIRVRAYNKNYPYKGLSIDNPMYLDLPFCDSKNEISDVLVEKIYRLAGTIL